MSKQGTGVPSLDEFLVGARTGACAVCAVPPELTAEIAVKIAEGLHAWAAYRRWLEAHGYTVTKAQLDHHFSARHHERP